MGSGDTKFRELILYLARKSEGDVHFGATKLNKQLFYADFIAYRQLGSSISGQRYQKLPYGPAPRGLRPVVHEMLEDGCCAEAVRSHHGYEQRRLLALREPDVSVFDVQELELIHKVVEELQDSSAREVSDLSHEFVGWQLADEREDIPYETALISMPEPPTEAEIQYGLHLAEERGEQTKSHPS